MRIQRSISEPLRQHLDWHATWQGPDRGLIKCWENGRRLALAEQRQPNAEQDQPGRAAKCRGGELPVSNWKGGVSRTLKKLTRYGSLNYLAEWQGLRGDDLDIDTAQEITLICTATGMIVTFTGDLSKLANQRTEEEEGAEPHGPASGIQEQSLFP
jgi:hypothetical protein